MSDIDDSTDYIKSTDHGFDWGSASITACSSFIREGGRYRVVQVRTKTEVLDIYISPKGRSVRVFKDHKEMK